MEERPRQGETAGQWRGLQVTAGTGGAGRSYVEERPRLGETAGQWRGPAGECRVGGRREGGRAAGSGIREAGGGIRAAGGGIRAAGGGIRRGGVESGAGQRGGRGRAAWRRGAGEEAAAGRSARDRVALAGWLEEGSVDLAAQFRKTTGSPFVAKVKCYLAARNSPLKREV